MYVVKLSILFLLLCLAVNFVYGQGKLLSNHQKDTVQTKIKKVDSLEPAIVTATFRPHMKGDTLEYNVEHLTMQPHANYYPLFTVLDFDDP